MLQEQASSGLEGHLLRLIPDALEQHAAQVALAKAGQHHGNDLVLVLGALGHLPVHRT